MAFIGERARAESGFLLLYSERDKPGSAKKSAHDGIEGYDVPLGNFYTSE
jgi:hypothetical protein